MVSELYPWTQTQAWTQTTNMGDDVSCVTGNQLDACLGGGEQMKKGNKFKREWKWTHHPFGVEKCRFIQEE